MSTGPMEAKTQTIQDTIKEVFDIYDNDHTGSIPTDKLKEVLQALGEEYDDHALAEFIAEADTNNTKTITFDKFCQLVKLNIGWNREEDKLVEAFRVFDHDGSGYLCTTDIKPVLATSGLAPDEIEDMLFQADCEGDGAISYEDLAKTIIRRAKLIQPAPSHA